LAAAAPSSQQRGRGGEERASSDGRKGRNWCPSRGGRTAECGLILLNFEVFLKKILREEVGLRLDFNEVQGFFLKK
jgi:hypothetical protein